MPKHPYKEVADTLRARIIDGTYPPGSQLPSRTEMCVMFNRSDTVIGSAMRLLHATGLIETLAGVGVYVKKTLPE